MLFPFRYFLFLFVFIFYIGSLFSTDTGIGDKTDWLSVYSDFWDWTGI